MIFLLVAPTFEAFSILRIQPIAFELYKTIPSDTVESRSVTPYLQTQVALLTSDRVLAKAITDPRVVNVSTIKESDDPKADLRKNMAVEIVKDAYLIRVALELSDGHQAAAIVNAVIVSYLAYNGEFKRGENSTLRQSLIAQRDIIQNEIKEKRAELKTLREKSTVQAYQA